MTILEHKAENNLQMKALNIFIATNQKIFLPFLRTVSGKINYWKATRNNSDHVGMCLFVFNQGKRIQGCAYETTDV